MSTTLETGNFSQITAAAFAEFSKSNSGEWKYAQTANVLLLSAGLWYVIALALHLKRRDALFNSSCREFDEFSMLRTMFYSGIFFLLRVAITGFIIHVPYMGFEQCNQVCEASNDMAILMYAAAQFLIYLYLWLQMKVYYDKQTELKTRSVPFLLLIWACFVLLVAGFITIAVSWVYPNEHECSVNGCVLKCHTCNKQVNALATFLVAFALQVFILCLIISVLCKQMSAVRITKTKISRNSYKLQKRNSGKITIRLQTQLVRAMKKLVCCASICMLSDICMLTISTKLVPSYLSRGISNIPYEVTLLVNMITMICTFNEPLAILFPCLVKPHADEIKGRRGSISIKL